MIGLDVLKVVNVLSCFNQFLESTTSGHRDDKNQNKLVF